ncbi:hypothetical protein Tco_1385903 [Tanacetum coccineum]
MRILLYFSPPGVKTPFLTPTSSLKAGGISSGWNFHDPYEEAARQLLEQAPRPSEYVPDPMELEDHVPIKDDHHLLPITTPAPSTICRADILETDMPPRKRLLLTSPTPRFEVGESFAACKLLETPDQHGRRVDHSFVDTIDTRALARSEAYRRVLEARIRVLETQAYHHEWQRQDADDRAIEHIIRTQALEARARVDTLEDTGSSA